MSFFNKINDALLSTFSKTSVKQLMLKGNATDGSCRTREIKSDDERWQMLTR